MMKCKYQVAWVAKDDPLERVEHLDCEATDATHAMGKLRKHLRELGTEPSMYVVTEVYVI